MTPSTQTIQVQAAISEGTLEGTVWCILHRPEGDQRLALTDDGSNAGDIASDGMFSAIYSGPPLRFVDLELELEANSQTSPLFRRIVLLSDMERARVSFFFESREGVLQVSRVAYMPVYGSSIQAGNQVALTAAFGWGLLCFAYVFFLVLRRLRR